MLISDYFVAISVQVGDTESPEELLGGDAGNQPKATATQMVSAAMAEVDSR